MKNTRIILALLLAFCGAYLTAQSVIITGKVLDPGGRPYVGGSGRAVLVSGNGSGSVYWTINSTNPVRSPIVISGLDSTGGFSIQLTNTSLIDQQTAKPQWQFSFCSISYPPQVCFTMSPLSLAANQDITAQIQAQSVPLPGTSGTTPGGPSFSVQVNNGSNAFIGYPWFTVNPTLQSVMTNDFRTANFPVLDVRDYSVTGDGTQLSTCSIGAVSSAVHCTTSSFTAADIGKGAFFSAAGAGGGYLNTTILTVVDANDITLATPSSFASTGLFFYGTDNTAAWCSMMNCTSSQGPNSIYTPSPGRRIFVPRGTYIFTGSIGSRNSDQLVGADQTATQFLFLSPTTSQTFLWLGSWNSSGTWILDSGGAENSVRGILFSTPESAAQTCINTNGYSGFDINSNWFECGFGINLSASPIGSVMDNTFDSNNWNGITATGGSISAGNYDTQSSAHSVIVTGNKFFLQHDYAMILDGVDGYVISNNTFNYSILTDINIASTEGYISHRMKIIGNNFVTADSSASYSCTGNYHINIAGALTDSVIANNNFIRGHEYDIGASGVLSGLIINGNTFRGSCEAGVCSNSCPFQTTLGQQLSAIDLEATTSSGVAIANNRFDAPGLYAVRTIGPVTLTGNTCSSPFSGSNPPSNNDYDNGCFTFPAPTASGSIIADNSTSTNTVAAVVASNGATGLLTHNNASPWTYDEVLSGGTDSTWGERVELQNGAVSNSSMNPATGQAVVQSLGVLSSATINNLTCTGSVSGCGAGGGGNVTGPVSSTTNDVPYFTDTTGQVIGDSAVPYTTLAQILSPPVVNSIVTGSGTGNQIRTQCGSNCTMDNLGDIFLGGNAQIGSGPSLDQITAQPANSVTLSPGYDAGLFVYNKQLYCQNSDSSSCLSSAGVSSFTGDMVVYSNSASTGGVTLTLNTQTANKIFAGPGSGSAAAPTFRSLVTADMPSLVPILTSANVWSNTNNYTGATITVPTQATSVSNTTAASTAYVTNATGSTPFITINSATADPICNTTNQTPWTCSQVSTTKTYFATSGTIPFASANGKIDAIHHGLHLVTQFDALWPSTNNGVVYTLNACSALSGQTCTGAVTLWSSSGNVSGSSSAVIGIPVLCDLFVNGSTATTLNVTCNSGNPTRPLPSTTSAIVTSAPNTGTNWVLVWSVTWQTAAPIAEGVNLDSMVGSYIP